MTRLLSKELSRVKSNLWSAVASAARHRFGWGVGPSNFVCWLSESKAPSSLRSAGALQRLGATAATLFLTFCMGSAVGAQTRRIGNESATASLPSPQLEYVGKEPFEVDGEQGTRFKLSVTNRNAHPDFLWHPTAKPQSCGDKERASRTSVEIFGSPGDKRLSGFCSLRSSEQLDHLWFVAGAGEKAPQCVYIVMTDRQTGKKFVSNRVCSRSFTVVTGRSSGIQPAPARDRGWIEIQSYSLGNSQANPNGPGRATFHSNRSGGPVNDRDSEEVNDKKAEAAQTDSRPRRTPPADTQPQRTAPPQRRKPTAGTNDVAAAPQPTLDRQAFEASLHAAVSPKVMGYTFLLIKDGRVAAEGAGGLARNAADGQMQMTTNTPQNLGSLFKFITGVTMLHLLDRAPVGSAGGNNSFQTRLDAPVALLYPQLWNTGVKTPAIRTITFRQLLQHKSGFRNCSTPLGCFGGTYDASLLGKREYENINFSLLGYLTSLYTNPQLLPALNGVSNSVPANERDANIQLILGDGMISFMREKMFPLAPGKISASCDAANEYKATGAYGYVSKTDTGKGIITSRKAGKKPCSGAGGNWMSIRDFGAFVAAALHSDRMLSQQARLEMYRTGMAVDDRLVWSFTTSDQWIGDKFNMSTIIWSNGIQPYDGGQSFNTVLLRLPLNYELMVFVNSGGMSVNSLASAGFKAFRAGME